MTALLQQLTSNYYKMSQRTRRPEVSAVWVVALLVPNLLLQIHNDPADTRTDQNRTRASEQDVLDVHDVVALVEAAHVGTPAVLVDVVDEKLLCSEVAPSSHVCGVETTER